MKRFGYVLLTIVAVALGLSFQVFGWVRDFVSTVDVAVDDEGVRIGTDDPARGAPAVRTGVLVGADGATLEKAEEAEIARALREALQGEGGARAGVAAIPDAVRLGLEIGEAVKAAEDAGAFEGDRDDARDVVRAALLDGFRRVREDLDVREDGSGPHARIAPPARPERAVPENPSRGAAGAAEEASKTAEKSFAARGFSGRSLNRVDFVQANFNGADFSDTTMNAVNFTGAFLSGASFRHAAMVDVRFTGARVEGGDFADATLRQVVFNTAQIFNTAFRDADMEQASFDGAYLNGVEFDDADLSGATFYGAVFENVRFNDVSGATPGAFRGACRIAGANPDGVTIPPCEDAP